MALILPMGTFSPVFIKMYWIGLRMKMAMLGGSTNYKITQKKSWKKVLADFAESRENQSNVISLIANGITYDLWVG